MKTIKKLFIGSLAFMLTACSGGGLTGTWHTENGEKTVDFKTDGVLETNFLHPGEDRELRYKIDDNSWLILSEYNTYSETSRTLEKSKKTDQMEEAMFNPGYWYLEDGTLIFLGNLYKR